MREILNYFLTFLNFDGLEICEPHAQCRSSRLEVSFKKSVLRNFAKFTGKHLCQSLFFNKVAGLRAVKKMTGFYTKRKNDLKWVNNFEQKLENASIFRKKGRASGS